MEKIRKYILDAIQQHLDEGYCTNYDMAQDKLEEDPSIAFDYAYDCGRYDTLNEFKREFAGENETEEGTEYIRFDFINDNEVADKYCSLEDLIKCTNEFYHETFQTEEGYDEGKEYKTLSDCVELWEGSGFGIAKVLKFENEGENK